MSTWLMDTPLFKMLATAKAKPLIEWCEANDASLFISVASLTEVALGISKWRVSQSQRASAQRKWLDEIIAHFADRIHTVDAAIAARAGELLPSRHRQARLAAHPAAQLRHAPARAERRHPRDPGVARTRQARDDGALYPRRRQYDPRRQEPAGAAQP